MAEVSSVKLQVSPDQALLTQTVRVDYTVEFEQREIDRGDVFELRIQLIGHDYPGDPQSEDRAYLIGDVFRSRPVEPAIVAFDFEKPVELVLPPSIKRTVLVREDHLDIKALQATIEGFEQRTYITTIFQQEDPGSHARQLFDAAGTRVPGQPNNDEVKARVTLQAIRRATAISNWQQVLQKQIEGKELD